MEAPKVGAAVGNLIGSISIKIQEKLQNGMGSKHIGKKKFLDANCWVLLLLTNRISAHLQAVTNVVFPVVWLSTSLLMCHQSYSTYVCIRAVYA